MYIIFLVVIFFGIVGGFEVVGLWKEKKKKELWIYSVLMGASFILSLLLAAGIPVPSPARFIESTITGLKGG